MNKVLVTGGAGFIGSHLTTLLSSEGYQVEVVDLLTYAGAKENVDPRAKLHVMDICHPEFQTLVWDYKPDAIFHLAAESHVDNSIVRPDTFIQTNVFGTFNLLEAIRRSENKTRLIHVSTDEVYGDLSLTEPAFTEDHPYKPSSPYSASKASSDLFVKAYARTYGIDAVVSNCSNNYGPRQHSEKLIPTIIRKLKSGEAVPIYGNGLNVRDWLYVTDHCEALLFQALNGEVGHTYNVGGGVELSNLEMTHAIASVMGVEARIEFVTDRKGHDFRYAINPKKLTELGWTAHTKLTEGLEKTVQFYLTK